MNVKKSVKNIFLFGFCLCCLCNVTIVSGIEIALRTEQSAKLPPTSWVVKAINEKFTNRVNEFADNWQENVIATYDCIETGATGDSSESCPIIFKPRRVNLRIPLKCKENFSNMDLSVSIKFKGEGVDGLNICELLHLENFQLNGSRSLIFKMEEKNPISGSYEDDVQEMRDCDMLPDFLLNEQVKIYSVKMGVYTWGYVL
jgi:hypothetical protein